MPHVFFFSFFLLLVLLDWGLHLHPLLTICVTMKNLFNVLCFHFLNWKKHPPLIFPTIWAIVRGHSDNLYKAINVIPGTNKCSKCISYYFYNEKFVLSPPSISYILILVHILDFGILNNCLVLLSSFNTSHLSVLIPF